MNDNTCKSLLHKFFGDHRSEDHEPFLSCRTAFTFPLMIIPGPKEPKNIEVYMQLVANEFQRHGPSGILKLCSLIICCVKYPFPLSKVHVVTHAISK